jgi:predicted AAA+ superfamily ATPase
MEMITTTLLEELLLDQKDSFISRAPGVSREINLERYRVTGQIVVISGVRRSGKSTLMRQFAALYPDFLYINFDDDRLMDFSVADFSTLMLVYGKISPDIKVIFIDEIQNVTGWERFVRRIHDDGYKIFLTGSNAKLLSAELGTHLTGRYAKVELFPFSFREMLRFKGISASVLTQKKKAEILREFDLYLNGGGFPEYLKYGDEEFLKRTYDDILFRDIIVRFGIREVKAFRQLASFLFTNTSNMASYNAIKKALGFKSVMSVRDYVGFLQEAYLVFELFKYDYSLKKQYVNDKKIYVIDTGMRNVVAFRFSDDRGRLLENLVFIELRRRGTPVYFCKDEGECDFVTDDRGTLMTAIQVCYDLTQENREREILGLANAMRTFSIPDGSLLTYNQEETIVHDGLTIKVLPVWKWLL